MSDPRLGDRFFETSRGRVVTLLRSGPKTVEELAAALELSDNAVRSHLTSLERDGLVRPQGVRRTATAGKPATLYEIPAEAETQFSRAYAPVLRALLDELASRAPETFEPAVMREVGKRIARALGVTGQPAAEAGAPAALAVFGRLGAEATATESARGVMIQVVGSCPLGDTASHHPRVCRAMEALLSEAAGRPMRTACDRGTRPRCAFEMRETR